MDFGKIRNFVTKNAHEIKGIYKSLLDIFLFSFCNEITLRHGFTPKIYQKT